MSIEDYTDKKKSQDTRLRNKNRAVHPSDLVKSLHNINDGEAFQNFAHALLGKLDDMTDAIHQQGSKIDAQAVQLTKMNEAFDMIMRDYFSEVTEGVQDFSSYVSELMSEDSDVEVDTGKSQESLLNRLELLKGRAELVEEKTVSFSSIDMQEIYQAIIPEMKKEINGLYDKIVKELEDMHVAGTKTTANNATIILTEINGVNQNLNSHARNITSKIRDSETSLKMNMPGNGRNKL